MGFDRFIRNQDEKQRQKRQMWDADRAVRCWRDSQDPSKFPDLRQYLARQTSYGRYESYGISGWGYVLSPALTAEEYAEMKAAYLETEAGKADTWKVKSDWL